eukprot:347894-Chlamydomonas_euryale.AAC.1
MDRSVPLVDGQSLARHTVTVCVVPQAAQPPPAGWTRQPDDPEGRPAHPPPNRPGASCRQLSPDVADVAPCMASQITRRCSCTVVG